MMLSALRESFQNCSDVVFYPAFARSRADLPLHVVYIDGMVSTELLARFIVEPLSVNAVFENAKNLPELFSLIERSGVFLPSLKKEETLSKITDLLLSGFCALVSEEIPYALVFEAKGFERRSTSPPDENVIKGAKDAFIESMRQNTSLVRQKLRTEHLRIEEFPVGEVSRTNVAVLYLDSAAPAPLVRELKERLQSITAPFLLSLGLIEEQLSDNKFSPFPQYISTERVDKFCANVAAGRVGLLVDGFPVAYVLPGEFKEFLEAPEDYSENWTIASFIRILRYFLIFIGVFAPALFISAVSYQPDLLPFRFALSIKAAKAGVPFPAFVEMLVIMISFEILIEAGIRLPNPAGQIVSIVGGLIVGEAAVSARIVSPIVVMVAATAAIASYSMPNADFGISLRIWNFLSVFLASFFGLLGVFCSFSLLLLSLCRQESFSVPYLSPFVAGRGKKSDALFRLPYHYRSGFPSFLPWRGRKGGAK